MATDANRIMKRVLFHYPILNVGGAEKSTLRMITALADRDWDVTLVLTTGGGNLEPEVDPRVRLVRLRPLACGHKFLAARGLSSKIRELPDLFCYSVMRCIGAIRQLPFLWRQYDAAALLLMGTPSTFLRRVVRANVKVIWVRNDLNGADPTGQVTAGLRSAASDIDIFVCVSEVSRQALVDAVPEAQGKEAVVYNLLRPDEMRARADENFSVPDKPSNNCSCDTQCMSPKRASERAKTDGTCLSRTKR